MIQVDLVSGGDFSVEISKKRSDRKLTAEVVIKTGDEELYERIKSNAGLLELTVEEWVSRLVKEDLGEKAELLLAIRI